MGCSSSRYAVHPKDEQVVDWLQDDSLSLSESGFTKSSDSACSEDIQTNVLKLDQYIQKNKSLSMVKVLRPLFTRSGLLDEEQLMFVKKMKKRSYKDGAVIASHKRICSTFYFILEGDVKRVTEKKEESIHHPGSYFGEFNLIHAQYHDADYISVSNTTCLSITCEALHQLKKQTPGFIRLVNELIHKSEERMLRRGSLRQDLLNMPVRFTVGATTTMDSQGSWSSRGSPANRMKRRKSWAKNKNRSRNRKSTSRGSKGKKKKFTARKSINSGTRRTCSSNSLIGDVLNDYKIIEKIGKGSFATVHLVEDIHTGMLFAKKCINIGEHERKRFGQKKQIFDEIIQEIAIMKKLSHPNCVKLHEVIIDSEKRSTHLVQEYLNRGPIMNEDAVNHRPLLESRVWRVFRDVLRGVRYLHFQDIVHRDIKPANILVNDKGVCKLSDFGMSSITSQNASFYGSPAFMSPELIEADGVSELDFFKADIWAMGVTLYMLCCGNLPFAGSNRREMFKHIRKTELSYPDISQPPSSNLWDLIQKMLKKNPTERISLEEIANHEWITDYGKTPMKFEVYEKVEVSGEEVYKKLVEAERNSNNIVGEDRVNTFSRAEGSVPWVIPSNGAQTGTEVLSALPATSSLKKQFKKGLPLASSPYTPSRLIIPPTFVKNNRRGRTNTCPEDLLRQKSDRGNLSPLGKAGSPISATNTATSHLTASNTNNHQQSQTITGNDSRTGSRTSKMVHQRPAFLDTDITNTARTHSQQNPAFIPSRRVCSTSLPDTGKPLFVLAAETMRAETQCHSAGIEKKSGKRSPLINSTFKLNNLNKADTNNSTTDNNTINNNNNTTTDKTTATNTSTKDIFKDIPSLATKVNNKGMNLPDLQVNKLDEKFRTIDFRKALGNPQRRNTMQMSDQQSLEVKDGVIMLGAFPNGNGQRQRLGKARSFGSHSASSRSSRSWSVFESLKNLPSSFEDDEEDGTDGTDADTSVSVRTEKEEDTGAIADVSGHQEEDEDENSSSNSTIDTPPPLTNADYVTRRMVLSGTRFNVNDSMLPSESASASRSSNAVGRGISSMIETGEEEEEVGEEDSWIPAQDWRKQKDFVDSKPTTKKYKIPIPKRHDLQSIAADAKKRASMSLFSAGDGCSQFNILHRIESSDDDIDDLIEVESQMQLLSHRSVLADPELQPLDELVVRPPQAVCGINFKTSHFRTSYGHCEYKNHRPTMEDRSVEAPFVLCKPRNGKKARNYGAFGIFDGHGGHHCSQFLKRMFPEIIRVQMESGVQPQEVLNRACVELDKQYLAGCARDDDGSTGLMLLLCRERKQTVMYSALVGDSVIVLSRGGVAMQLLRPHSISADYEQARLKSCGAWIHNGRLNGSLAISRAFGDRRHKGGMLRKIAGEDSPSSETNDALISTPDIRREVVKVNDEFVILCSDGVVEGVSMQEMVNFVRRSLVHGFRLNNICKLLALKAVEGGAIDNISITIVCLNQECGPVSSASASIATRSKMK